jgi:hypothetical protein
MSIKFCQRTAKGRAEGNESCSDSTCIPPLSRMAGLFSIAIQPLRPVVSSTNSRVKAFMGSFPRISASPGRPGPDAPRVRILYLPRFRQSPGGTRRTEDSKPKFPCASFPYEIPSHRPLIDESTKKYSLNPKKFTDFLLAGRFNAVTLSAPPH